jgi:hypothetical protein
MPLKCQPVCEEWWVNQNPPPVFPYRLTKDFIPTEDGPKILMVSVTACSKTAGEKIGVKVEVSDSNSTTLATCRSSMYANQVEHLTLPTGFANVDLTAGTPYTLSIEADSDYGETKFDEDDYFSIAIAELDQAATP